MNIIWQYFEGRDRDLDKFAYLVAIHGSGRILARICMPLGEEFVYRLYFKCDVPPEVLKDANADFSFIDADSAKRFAEQILARFDPNDCTSKVPDAVVVPIAKAMADPN